jgi:hypothetical protein
MQDTWTLFETQESLAKNFEAICSAIEWLKSQKPEAQVQVIIVPSGMLSWRYN